MELRDCLEGLREALGPAGLGLLGAARVGDHNAGVPAAWHLPELGAPEHAVIIIGHDRGVWAPFVAALRQSPRLAADPHPFDRWTSAAIDEAIGLVLPPTLPRELRHVWEAPPRQVAMQALAVDTGLATRGPAGLVIDPRRGPWIAFRAALVVPLVAPPASSPSLSPCASCPDRPCVSALDRALRDQQRPATSLDDAHRAEIQPLWRQWVAVRDACPVGHDFRYSDAQIRYHYARDRQALSEEPD